MAAACAAGDELEIDLVAGEIHNLTQGRVLAAASLDPRAAELLDAGGLIPYLKHKYMQQRRGPCPVTV
jgi:3-isopropylmalate dehydratase small subunit